MTAIAGSAVPVTAQVALGSTAATAIAAADPSRRYLSLFNLSTAVDVFIGPSTVASSTNGYPLRQGTAFVISDPLTTGAIYGIAGSTVGATIATIKW